MSSTVAAANSAIYCPLIQQMVNSSSEPSNATVSIGTLATVCLHGVVSSLGILENLFILGVVGFHVRRSVISMWILNLAASDLLATASLPFFTLFMARGNSWTLGTALCRLHSSVFFLNMFVSGFLLAAISLDRCLVVLKPVWAQNHRSVRLVRKVCGLIWTVALLCTVPFYLFRDTIVQRSGKVMCYYNYARFLPAADVDLAGLCKARHKALAFMKFFLAFLCPLVVIVASYAAVMVQVSRRGHHRSFRFVRLLVAVVVSFVICWAPYHLFSLMEVLALPWSYARQLSAGALPLVASLSFLNSVLNPVLYVFSCPNLCSKIRQSMGEVMETVLAEDLWDLSRRRSTAPSVDTTEVLQRQRLSLSTLGLKEAKEKQRKKALHSEPSSTPILL